MKSFNDRSLLGGGRLQEVIAHEGAIVFYLSQSRNKFL